ncbi:siderophore-interacting protein [Herbiconiux sp. KACC 21604]|uniref:siderophore-interacting protein n=1 Tax=unclassified Herbiconiux TaxID=2618217 RepID=UPI001492A8B8|nr:siderophore-interacting protein [Herbiconiux sp. SALV-R1]QJU54274.1 siderophore-interacting protein [Herbiconiux sp. SALV-R1]WPO85342.1 siderophore-interacting protein [Herbiconiux sp. KACC 21604]
MSTQLTVTEAGWFTPTIRRVRFHSDDLSAFDGSSFTDRYVKLLFPKPGVDYPETLDLRALRGTMPPEQLPDVRTYTALHPDTAAGTLTIDFVVHGDTGVAGPWAAAAKPGDTLAVNGPGGAYRPDPGADWHLLAGDESAVPAIVAAVEALPRDAVARVVLLVEREGTEPQLDLPSRGTVEHLYRHAADGTDAPADALETAVRALEWPEGRVHAFVHGEAEEVMHGIRPYLLTERGLSRSQVSISGYWRRGRTEEGFRQWKAELARAEAAAEAAPTETVQGQPGPTTGAAA